MLRKYLVFMLLFFLLILCTSCNSKDLSIESNQIDIMDIRIEESVSENANNQENVVIEEKDQLNIGYKITNEVTENVQLEEKFDEIIKLLEY